MFLDWLFRLVLLFYTATQDSSKYYENVHFPTASLSGYYYFRDFASFRPKRKPSPFGRGAAFLISWWPNLLPIMVGVWDCAEQDPEKLP